MRATKKDSVSSKIKRNAEKAYLRKRKKEELLAQRDVEKAERIANRKKQGELRAERRERYLEKKLKRGKVISLSDRQARRKEKAESSKKAA